MRRNITKFERGVRLVFGFAILFVALGFTPTRPWLALVALVPLGTAILGYCPLYQLLRYDPLHRPTA